MVLLGGLTLLFDIWLVIIVLMLVGGVVLRIWQRRLSPVILHKVSAQAASQLVAEFLLSSYDGQFGYPTGRFHIERADETQVVAREVVGKGSHFTQILSGMYRTVLGLGVAFGCVGSIMALFLAALLTPALIYAALTEMALKYLLRSQIVASFEPAEDGTAVAFILRGPVALLVGRRVEHAFHPPVLPARVAGLTGIAAPSGATS